MPPPHLRCGQQIGGVVGLGVRARKDMHVEHHEIHHVKTQGLPLPVDLEAQIGAGPVQQRHEVVADRLDARARQIAHRLDPCRDLCRGTGTLQLDRIRHPDRLAYIPAQAGLLDPRLKGRDIP